VASPATTVPVPESLQCQTAGCGNAIAVVITRIEDNEADILCMSCCMAFWASVLQQAVENGTLQVLADTASGG
jgi:hypothetical protein